MNEPEILKVGDPGFLELAKDMLNKIDNGEYKLKNGKINWPLILEDYGSEQGDILRKAFVTSKRVRSCGSGDDPFEGIENVKSKKKESKSDIKEGDLDTQIKKQTLILLKTATRVLCEYEKKKLL